LEKLRELIAASIEKTRVFWVVDRSL